MILTDVKNWFRTAILCCLAAALGAVVPAPAAAQENVTSGTLNLSAPASVVPDPTPAAAAGAAQGGAPSGAAGFFASTELSGFVDAYYSYNFNTPATACLTVGGVGAFNCLHNFDFTHNSFSLNLAELALEKKPTADSRGGFRLDLDYGPTMAWVHGLEPGGVTIFQNIQQAYVSYLVPTAKGSLQFDFGKWVTRHGAEVIETKDNWNYSRSLLFALSIPYYHMGVKMTYAPNDKVTVAADIMNGWNNVVDNNTGKTLGLMATYKPTPEFSVTSNYMGGPEQTGNNDDWRHMFDFTALYTASPQVSLMANYDYGHDAVGDGIAWQGVGGYLKYQPNSWFALIPRYEFLKDDDAFMTGVSQDVQEFTLTAEFKHKDGVMMRVEYRGDFADTPYFLKDVSETKKNQNVFTVGWVYAFNSKTP